jgi:thymidylate synthase
VATVYEEPREKVLYCEERDANPFLHFFEALWLLAGRNDVAFLAQFLPRLAEYSDNGRTFHGAYGYRLRTRFGKDQLVEAAARLKKEPDTRQVVLQIWSCEDDLNRPSKDIPCLAGDTVLWSPEGDLAIEEVADKFASGAVTRWPVYAVDEQTKELRLSWCNNAWKTGEKPTVKLSFDDGSQIRVTPDHVLYRRGRNATKAVPVQAGQLRLGDRVLATRRWYTPKGHEQVKKQLGTNTAFDRMQRTHQVYAEMLYGTVPPGHVVHHVNDDKLDNRGENLAVVTKSWHDSHHRMGDRNPMRNLTPEQHRARAAKQSLALRENWAQLSEEEWQERVDRMHNKDNHVITALEMCEPEEVYDFTVPGYHTALVGTGVVAHNCNDTIAVKIRDRMLHLTVFCRSNDLSWGAYGVNAVQFATLGEYLAGQIGVPLGTYTQISDSFHAYTEREDWQRIKDLPRGTGCPYVSGHVKPYPLMDLPSRFDADLKRFLEDPLDELGKMFPTGHGCRNSFIWGVAEPMYRAWHAHKTGKNGAKILMDCLATDWRHAALAWLARREDKLSPTDERKLYARP